MKRRIRAACCLLLSACGGGEPAARVVTRDSAGVQIVETRRPRADEYAPWRIAADPHLVIGTADGPEHLLFHEIAGALQLGDGRIVIADRGSSTIRYFSATGAFLATTGRPGEGPGEYRGITRIQRLPGDSVVVVDSRLGRITILDSTDPHTGVRPVAWTGSRLPTSVLRLEDGRWVGVHSNTLALPGRVQAGVARTPAVVTLHDTDGSVTDTLGTFLGTEVSFTELEGHLVPGVTPFGRRFALAVHDEFVHVGTGDDLGYDVFGADGRHVLRVRAGPLDLTLTRADLDSFRATLLAAVPDGPERRELEAFLANAPHPDRRAAWTRMLTDAAGNVWLSDYELDPLIRSAAWRVFRSDGRYLGVVAVPEDLYLLDIGEDYVLGRARDALGVESVRVHALHKAPLDEG